ncbi:MAG: hypothetical protein KatS3mg102_0169 [Planctomycetota bacterium]|nr:MAG: hypothetical protein KatS3mg102_0169 [Planctomycetota bacterium]
MRRRTDGLRAAGALAVLSLLLTGAVALPARAAEERGRCARLLAQGDELFRLGDYFGASEAYKGAVFAAPRDGHSRLRFALALFALGRYDYAAYSLRRGLELLGYPDGLWVEVRSAFPAPAAFERARHDLEVYLRHYPGEPHALAVLAFVDFMDGQPQQAARACRALLEANPRDALAAYLQRRLELLEQPPQQPPPELAGAAPPAPPDHARPAPSAPGERAQPDEEALGALRRQGRRAGTVGVLSHESTEGVIAR